MNRLEFYSNLKEYKNHLSHDAINKYYRKEDLGNSKWRYFYSKEEWDAYQNNKKLQGASADNAKGKGQEYQKYLDKQKFDKEMEAKKKQLDYEKSQEAREKYNNMQAQTVKEYSDIAKKNVKQAAKEFFKEDAVTELLDDVKQGLKDKTITIDDTGRFKYSDSKTEELIDKELDNLQKWCIWIGKDSGTDRQFQKELSDLLQEEFNKYKNS